MKILRTLRRKKIRLSFIFLLLLFFIFNTYAWMSMNKNSSLGGLTLEVSSWDVAFIINEEEIKTEEYIFEIPEFHPGITENGEVIEKNIEVWNIGESDSFIEYEITDIYLYGMQVYKEQNDEGIFIPETIGEEIVDENENTMANMFGNEEATIFDTNNTYYRFLIEENENIEDNQYCSLALRYPTPFTITYKYGTTQIRGAGNENEPGSRSKMTISLNWDNNELNNEEDTKIGNLAYDFENAKDKNGNLLYDGEPALKIKVRVTAKKDSNTQNTYEGNGT